jgi:hypothetical protein
MTVSLLRYDAFLLGKERSEEETLNLLREILPDKIPPDIEILDFISL